MRITNICQRILRKAVSTMGRICGRTPPAQSPPFAPPILADGSFRNYAYDVLAAWPHDPNAYTQGLAFVDGRLFESTGLIGQSRLREVELGTGRVLREVRLPDECFGEGIAVCKHGIFQLTWMEHKAFVYEQATLRVTGTFEYAGEGWGLATVGELLVMSDGTDRLRFRDPYTFKTKRTVRVKCNGRTVRRLNDLEHVRGEIWANLYRSDYVISLDPKTGVVTGAVDFGGLLEAGKRPALGVLNGIAYDSTGDRMFVTGKLWPKIFEVRLRLAAGERSHSRSQRKTQHPHP
jgi:glutamine cyclotransferase